MVVKFVLYGAARERAAPWLRRRGRKKQAKQLFNFQHKTFKKRRSTRDLHDHRCASDSPPLTPTYVSIHALFITISHHYDLAVYLKNLLILRSPLFRFQKEGSKRRDHNERSNHIPEEHKNK
jgi:hypothetical protein